MLAFDPADRITVVDALAHPYLESYHEIGDEPECSVISERWREIEAIDSDFDYRKAIWKEVYDFRLSVRRGDGLGEDLPPEGEEGDYVADEDAAVDEASGTSTAPEDGVVDVPKAPVATSEEELERVASGEGGYHFAR